MLKSFPLALAALVWPAGAMAHIVFAEPRAEAGSYHAGFLRVSHGCGDSPTVALRVEIPAGVLTARPQPKPGWMVAIETAPLPRPVAGEGGRPIATRVVAVTWSGLLPIDQFDQFGLMLKLPAEAGPLYFPTVQRCRSGETRWTEIPPEPARWHDLEHPAPMLVLTAPDAAAHHGH